MAVTFEDLRDNEEIRGKFNALTPAQRDIAFSKMEKPKGFSDSQVELLKSKILTLPVTNTETGETDVPLEWKDVPLEALKNTPSSAIEFAKGIWQSVRHPIQTGKSVGSVALGGIQKAIPGEQASEQSFDSVVEFFKERYGGVDNLKSTIATDPVGFLNDASVVVTGGAGAVKHLSTLAKAGNVAKTAGTISKTASLVDPVTAVTKGAASLASKGVPRVSKSLVKSVLKPQLNTRLSEAQKLQRADELAIAFLDQNLRLKRKSVNRLRADIDAGQEVINNIIKNGKIKGGSQVKVNIEELLVAVDNVKNDLEVLGIKNKTVVKNIEKLNKIKNELRESVKPNMITGARELTPKQLQDLKLFENKRYTPNVETATSALNKVVDDELRSVTMNRLNDFFNDAQLKELNNRQGIKLELEKTILKRIRERESAPTVGVKGLVAGGGGAAAGAIAGGGSRSLSETIRNMLAFGTGSIVAERIITSPTVQISIARAINKLNTILSSSGKLGKVTTPAFQAGRVADELEKQQ